MHTIKNIISRVVGLISGKEDSLKVRKEEEKRKRFRTSWVIGEDSKLPEAPFVLSKEEVNLANAHATQVRVPSGFDWRPRDIFSKQSGMKSHEWKQVATHGILKFCLRNTLGHRHRRSIFQLLDVITKICSEKMMPTLLSEIEEEVHKAPVTVQVIMFHLIHHLPIYLRRFGPVYAFWMFPFERFNSWIS